MSNLSKALVAAAGNAAKDPSWDVNFLQEYPISWGVVGVLSGTVAVTDQSTAPYGVHLSPDGSKLYIISSSNDTVFEYTVTTPGDISGGLTYVQSLDVSSEEVSPTDLFFKPDGTQLYVVGSSGDEVNQYELSTAWDISTASWQWRKTISGTSPQGLCFSPDGLHFYVCDVSTDSVYWYEMSTAWDVRSASISGTLDISALIAQPNGVFFKSDGTRMFIIDDSDEDIFSYSLSTDWDVTTASFDYSINYSSDFSGPEGICFNSDGTKFYLVGTNLSQGYVKQYDVDPFYVGGIDNNPNGIAFSADGTNMYVSGFENDAVSQWSLSDAWNPASAIYLGEYGTADTQPTSIRFKGDGTKMYVSGDQNNSIYEYDLSVAWDVTSASLNNTLDVSAQDGAIESLFISTDGTKLYFTGNVNDKVFQYDLSVAWDISSATYNQSLDNSSQSTTIHGVFFKDDGLSLFIASLGNVYQYNLSTAWDISSASFYNETNAIGGGSRDIFIKPDGLELFSVGTTSDTVNRYSFTS